jgi:sirohydrochlorin ferrochelatase
VHAATRLPGFEQGGPAQARRTRPSPSGAEPLTVRDDMPALVAVAHGSRDPRSPATIAQLMAEVRRQRPDLDVRLSFLDLSAPRLPDALAAVAADGHRRAVVVPLLLGRAFHARVDVPGAVARAAQRHPQLDIATADVLSAAGGADAPGGGQVHSRGARGGADPRSGAAPGDARPLEDAALRRLATVAGPLDDPGLGVVLAAIGSSHPEANAAVGDVAAGWARHFGWAGATAAFATAAEPTVAQAITALRARGAQRVAVAPWILAPGLLPDRIAAAAHAGGAAVAAPMGPDPAVAGLVVERFTAATAAEHRAAS